MSLTSKVILVLCDSLRDDVAAQHMGYLEHLIEERQGTRYTVIAGLPTLSRPLYETIHTGVPVHEHGIASNRTVRRSTTPNIFEHVRKHSKTTAAAAYSWYSELYIRAPYDRIADREVDDETALIQHGRFYSEDDYPDLELFSMGMMLVQRFTPDYLLIHPMGLDYIGHQYGGHSPEYANHAAFQDQIMANLIPFARQLGYTLLITGDHGMNSGKQHNGTLPDVRHMPLYLLPAEGTGEGNTGQKVSQLQIAPTILDLLGMSRPLTMKQPSLLDLSETHMVIRMDKGNQL